MPVADANQIFSIAAFLLGAVVGSFLNVVILRLPAEGESIVYPPSRCPACGAAIRWYDNIPLLSYLVLRGRCRACRGPISLQYPLVEFCMALLSLALYTKFGLSFEFFFYFLFLAGLVAIIFIDISHMIIPNVISLPGVVLGFGGAFVASGLTWQQSGLGILLGGGMLYLVRFAFTLLMRQEAMGLGDIKLLAMIGAFLGVQSLLFVVFASSLIGSIVGIITILVQRRGRRTPIPFGPFLALGAILFLFFQERIFAFWAWYAAGGWL